MAARCGLRNVVAWGTSRQARRVGVVVERNRFSWGLTNRGFIHRRVCVCGKTQVRGFRFSA